jgi:hypothetical protein
MVRSGSSHRTYPSLAATPSPSDNTLNATSSTTDTYPYTSANLDQNASTTIVGQPSDHAGLLETMYSPGPGFREKGQPQPTYKQRWNDIYIIPVSRLSEFEIYNSSCHAHCFREWWLGMGGQEACTYVDVKLQLAASRFCEARMEITNCKAGHSDCSVEGIPRVECST